MKIFLAIICLGICFPCFAQSNPPPPRTANGVQKDNAAAGKNGGQTSPKQYGTEETPAFIKIVPAVLTADESTYKQYEHQEKPTLERWITWGTVALAGITAILAYFTFGLWSDARRTGKTNSTDMRDSINESIRAADAMEAVATAMQNNTALMQGHLQKQMRAYVSVDTGTPTCQDGKLRFAAAPVMINTGFTPARNVSHRIKAGILDLSSGKDHVFDESAEMRKTDAVLSPRQTFVLNSVVEDHFSDDDVHKIMEGVARRLFVWGTITYDDIFDHHWETNFCHNFIFFKTPNEKGVEIIKFLAYYYRSHNNAT